MLHNSITYVCEGINPFKVNVSSGFNFQYFARNVCHGLTNFCRHISDIAITTIKNVDLSLRYL